MPGLGLPQRPALPRQVAAGSAGCDADWDAGDAGPKAKHRNEVGQKLLSHETPPFLAAQKAQISQIYSPQAVPPVLV